MKKKPVCGANTTKCTKCGKHRREHGTGKTLRHAFKAKPCEETKLKPNGRCRQHGGDTPSGPASPHFVHGRYSKALPVRLWERFEASQRDPDLLNLRAELSLVDARIEELLGRASSVDAGRVLREAHDAFQASRKAKAAKQPDTARKALARVGRLLRAGSGAEETWDELPKTIELRKKLAEAEAKRLKDLHQVVTVERVMVFVAAIYHSIKQHVDDRQALRAIADDLQRLTGRGVSAADPAGRGAGSGDGAHD